MTLNWQVRQAVRIWQMIAIVGSVLIGSAAAVPALAQNEERAEPQEQGAEAKEAPEIKAARQIFQGLIQQLVPGGRAARPNQEHAAEPLEASADGRRDFIDGRAPLDSEAQGIVRRIERAADNGQWDLVISSLQPLLERSEDSLLRLPDGELVSFRSHAIRLLGRMPANWRENYRAQYGALAQERLNLAVNEGTATSLSRVATQYFHTDAGYEAANRLGSIHLDRGERTMAGFWFARLVEADAPCVRRPTWVAKASIVLADSPDSDVREKFAALVDDAALRPALVGGESVDLRNWVAGRRQTGFEEQPLDEWPSALGTSGRNGFSRDGNPVLVPRWERPVSNSHAVRDQVRMLRDDLSDAGAALIPSLGTVSVGKHLAIRTLAGIDVVSLATGELVWSSHDEIAPEKILTGEADFSDSAMRIAGQRRAEILSQEYFGGDADQHPLTSLLFRDTTFGVIAGNGSTVYVLEDHATLSQEKPNVRAGFRGGNSPDVSALWSSNTLSAYNLKTGHLLWSAGGSPTGEGFDGSLAGYFFCGVPLADGGELFVIGEREGEIRLICLDASSGEPRWTQLIAYVDTKIQQDPGRRLWTAQPSIADGVVVCPTGVGWMVGVDRVRHSVLWAHRYSRVDATDREDGASGSVAAPLGTLNSRWSAIAPVIDGGYVVYTPPEEPLNAYGHDDGEIVCLNLMTGEKAWKRSRQGGLYLAGVRDRHVLIVGMRRIFALDLETGSTEWETLLDDAEKPCGRAAVSESFLYVPLESGEVWTVDIENGEVRERLQSQAGSPGLGNLTLVHGKLVSVSAADVLCFEHRDDLQKEIADRKADGEPGWSGWMSGELALLDGDVAAALSALEAVDATQLSPERRERHRLTLTKALSASIRQDPASATGRLERIAALATNAQERHLHHRLVVHHLSSSGKFAAAYREILTGLKALPSEGLIVEAAPGRHVDARRWAAGQLAEIWDQLDETSRQELREDRSVWEATVAATGVAASVLFPNFDAAWESELESVLADGDSLWSIRELRLLRLSQSPVNSVAANAWRELARLLTDAGYPQDGALALKYAESRDGMASADELRQKIVLPGTSVGTTEAADAMRWSQPLQARLSATGYTSTQSQHMTFDSPWPYFAARMADVDTGEGKIALRLTADDHIDWLTALRQSSRSTQSTYVPIVTVGHAVVVLHADVIQVLSPLDRSVLWSLPLDHRAYLSGAVEQPQRPMPDAAMTLESLLSEDAPLEETAPDNGRLVGVTAAAVYVLGRHELSAYDTIDGALLWRREGLPKQVQIFPTGRSVLAISASDDFYRAFDAVDGRDLSTAALRSALKQTFGTIGDDLLVVERRQLLRLFGLRDAEAIISRVDAFDGTVRWRVDVPEKSLIARVDSTSWLIVRKHGETTLLDADNGVETPFEPLLTKGHTLADVHEMYAIPEGDRLYVILGKEVQNAYFPESISSVRTHGVIGAYDRRTGKLDWRRDVETQNLIVDQLSGLPCLLFVARTWEQQANIAFTKIRLLALDKQTGETLLEQELPTLYGGYHRLTFDRREDLLELRSYNQRIRLRPAHAESAAEAGLPMPPEQPSADDT